MAYSREEWVEAFAARLGVPAPDAVTTDQLLALAASAAHASERTAAPIACYLAALAGMEPARAAELAAAMEGES